MKIAISGKGGVGKTTLAACLSKYYAQKSFKVIAVDADPDANLASALGLEYEKAKKIIPLIEMKEFIEERTGAKSGQYGSYFKLNPKVDDIPQKYGIEIDGVRLLVAGTIKAGGSGCYCPENVLLKRLFKHLVVDRDEIIILDMEAGIEHLGRGTCENMDILIVVIEPGLRSIQTAYTVKKMSSDLGVKSVFIVINKIKSESEKQILLENLEEFEVLGELPYSDKVRESDLKNYSPCVSDIKFKEAVENIANRINKFIRG
ncbi:MAG: carbon monoxide dehydrogenase [Actinobacteria bacterium]|nr:carbon monoxide dehydrogenase [Actinomycetota bacterium]MBM3712665.1 carbon monoxide dehydrogenase [Actinomycetota bacterium]